MLVKVNFNTSTAEDAEWCILEFQGEIAGEPYNGEELGALTVTSASSVQMEIGLHTL